LNLKVILVFFVLNLILFQAKSNAMVLDKLAKPGKTTQDQQWEFFTDGVMGGLSDGNVKLDKINKENCYRMTGNVTTENNGGFIQIRAILKPSIKASNYEGIYLKVYGNNERYYLSLRTPYTKAPWQNYKFGFKVKKNWQEIKAPFSKFKRSHFYQPKDVKKQKIKSVGLVAGFDDFKADICLAEIGFY